MKKFMTQSRRNFLTKSAPACALFCLGMPAVAKSMTNLPGGDTQEHKFDRKMPAVTARQSFSLRYKDLLSLARELQTTIGKKETSELLRNYITKKNQGMAKSMAERDGGATLAKFTRPFRMVDGPFLTIEIIEDTETVFEMKVTECIWADYFLKMNAGDIGHDWICWGDYAAASGYSDKLHMERDQTLMQGHSCCNHRYIWKG